MKLLDFTESLRYRIHNLIGFLQFELIYSDILALLQRFAYSPFLNPKSIKRIRIKHSHYGHILIEPKKLHQFLFGLVELHQSLLINQFAKVNL